MLSVTTSDDVVAGVGMDVVVAADVIVVVVWVAADVVV